MREALKHKASKPRLTINVETLGQSVAKDVMTFTVAGVALWVWQYMGLSDNAISAVGIFVVAVGVLAIMEQHASWGSTISAPPEDVGDIIHQWMEATADDHDEDDETRS